MNTHLHFPAINNSRLHLGVTGSVSAYKAIEIMRAVQKFGVGVSVTLTPAAEQFIRALSFTSLGATKVYGAMFSPADSPFDHLEPGTVAHSFAIAPLSATTMARLATGTADSMLAAQALAHPRPLILAPAMNPRMWANTATLANKETLEARGHTFVEPASGLVACGEEGTGKLAPVDDIVWAILRDIACARGLQPLAGKKVMVTLGPTREQWDGVRVWTNLSTGLMGSALATAAWLMGADVHAIAGPGVPQLPASVHRHDVTSALSMFTEASAVWPAMDYGIFTAAVADFSPEPFGKEKFKKEGHTEGFSITFKPNQDILATLANNKTPSQKVMGFAAETSDLETKTTGKLTKKKADMVVGNPIGQEHSGFGTTTNEVFVATRSQGEFALPCLNKGDIAWRLLETLCAL